MIFFDIINWSEVAKVLNKPKIEIFTRFRQMKVQARKNNNLHEDDWEFLEKLAMISGLIEPLVFKDEDYEKIFE